MVGIIVGTRPEIIKMAPIINNCGKRGLPFFILHSGQHYSANMDRIFFEEMGLPQPKYNLGVGNFPYNKQVGKMVGGMTKILNAEKPSVVIVQGDTTTVLAGALSANKVGIPVVHHEAGVRSYDLQMIEEINRITTDHISDFLFTPTELASSNLIEEGCPKEKIYCVGNSIVDAVLQYRDLAETKSDILSKLSLNPRGYFLLTLHRPENVDYKHKLEEFIRVLEMLKMKYPTYKFVCPLHPRTRKMMEAFSLSLPANIIFIDPLAYFDFLKIQSNARLVITDSGGIQEESCVLKVPCVVARENTERPEAMGSYMGILAGLDTSRINFAIDKLLRENISWSNPFGDGRAAEKMMDILQFKLKLI